MLRQLPERIRSLDWHEPGVTLGEVLAELPRLHGRLSRRGSGYDEHPHPRNCVLNLVAVTDGATRTAQIERAGGELAAHHPLRLLVLQLQPSQADRMDAWIHTEAHQTGDGMPTQYEMVRLHVSGRSARHPASLIEPLLVPDVPTFLWWAGSPPVEAEWFLQMLDAVDALVVDSASFERPFLATLELAQLAGRRSARPGVLDLQWGRLRPWRELLAQFFTPAERRAFLYGINGVGVDYFGEGRGNRIGAALMVGWLASALGWRLERAAAGPGGLVVAYFEAERGHPIEVDVRSIGARPTALALPAVTASAAGPQLPAVRDPGEGEVAAIRLDAAAGATTCALRLERDREHGSRVGIRIDIGAVDSLTSIRLVESPDDAALLHDMIPAGWRDPVYLSALAGAAELLRAFG